MATKLQVTQISNNSGAIYIDVFGNLVFSGNYGSATGATTSAAITASITNGVVTGTTITNAGAAYTTNPGLLVVGGGGAGAKLLAVVSGGSVTSVTVLSGGSGYTAAPTVIVINEVITFDYMGPAGTFEQAGLPQFREVFNISASKAPAQIMVKLQASLEGGATIYSVDVINQESLSLLGSQSTPVGSAANQPGIRIFTNGVEASVGSAIPAAVVASIFNYLSLKYRKLR
jgi:hypothetical protein